VLRDITEKKEAETKLAEQAGLLELTSDAIIVRDELGRIAYWNKGAEALYGWSQPEAVGKITHDLLRTKFPQPFPEVLERLRKEKRWQGELVHTRKDGEQVTVFCRLASIGGGADDAGRVLEINTDITRRTQLEAALQSNERLALAGRLSASIAHEINNPIDAVSNALYLINQRINGQREVEKLISLAQKEAQRVAEITRNMLSLHRESRSPSPVKLSQLLEGVVALIEETIAKGRRNIEVVPGFEGELQAFPSELRQVFTNVIKNAIEATAADGEIKIYSKAVQESGQDGVLVQVVDNGVGIPEQLQPKLFSPFVTTKEETGTGLGLWVSRSIVEKHGGSIRLSSGSGPGSRGTEVSIFLPLEAKSPARNDRPASVSASQK
jgi:PAS domain S-box-containing protein